jgi:plastocyanin domain-containing protein
MKRMFVSVAVVTTVLSGALLLGACQQNRTGQSRGEVHVDVTDKGFEPAEVQVPAGHPVTLVITRKTDQTCIKEVLFENPSQRVELPLNEPVSINLPASSKGTLTYQCGEKMISGKVVVQ